jgi:uncharacterized low-complexity protein
MMVFGASRQSIQNNLLEALSMTRQRNLKPLAIAAGAVLATSMTALPSADADQNPFGLTHLSSGYTVVHKGEGSCGEGKCGKNKDKLQAQDLGNKGEGKCGEGKCGDN